MTLYFDTKVQFLIADTISTICVWHPIEPISAIASFSQDHGGSITIFDDKGEPLRDITYPAHPVSQSTALCWHPEKKILVSGWENGEVHAWFTGNKEFSAINGPHKSPIVFMEFSEQGGRMITSDAMGVLTGWRCDKQGQFLTMFTHDLRDPVLHVTFRKTVPSIVSTELSNLARAAVAGDETALDTLTNWRPRTAARNLSHSGVKDNQCFYVGTQTGIIYYINQSGMCTEVLRTESAIIVQVLWHPKREAIVTLMEDLTVGHYLVESTGQLTELDRVKLSGRIAGQNGTISWAGNSLAIITGDFNVRIWDIDTSDNFLLPLMTRNSTTSTSSSSSALPNDSSTLEMFSCIAYCSDNQTLCAGTNQGNLYTWKRTNYSVDVPENTWQLNNVSAVRGAIKQCTWGVGETGKPCVMVNCVSNVYILKEQPLVTSHCRDIWAIQKSANQIAIVNVNEQSVIVYADICVTDLWLTERNLIITNGRIIIVYKLNRNENFGSTQYSEDQVLSSTDKNLTFKSLNTFAVTDCLQLFAYDEAIIILAQNGVKIYSFGGVVLRELICNESEGKPIGGNLTGTFLTIFTINGYIKIFDVSRHHEPKQITPTKCGYDIFENFGEIIMAKCNGVHLLVTIANENLIPDGKLYVWDYEKNLVNPYDFFGKSNKDESRKMEEFIPRLPVEFFWDTDDNRLLVCEARCIQKSTTKTLANSSSSNHPNNNNNNNRGITDITTPTTTAVTTLKGTLTTSGSTGSMNYAESQANIMFVTDKCELKELEIVEFMSGEKLVNLCAPHVITLKLGSIERVSLRDFKGLAKTDVLTRKMILDFSLNVAEGNMDQAFRCIRSIQSEAVWENLAKMCVQTGRLDVARVCLGHLKRARSVRQLRKAMDDLTLEPDARTAILAIELDMIEEAEQLYRKCGRYDLLNKLLQACGRFDEAIKIAEQLDRIHLKNTYFKYGEWLKEQGDIQGALEYFNKSNNPTNNVTQMLMENPISLKQYMQNTTDPSLLKWWGQYIESTGDMESAFKIYQKAEDSFSQVRVLCFLGQLAKADSIARQSGDKAACYHLARHFENIGKIQDAIQFYTRAQTYGNAVRICKENDLQDELWNVANSARGRDKAMAAIYFEECGNYKRAVELYHRAGMLHKAVELAFTSQQPDILQVIAAELDSNSDPELIGRCAQFFLEIEQPQKAVQLLATAKQYERALEICSDKGVPITETLSELLTPMKEDTSTDTQLIDPQSKRITILIQLGEILQEQGDYHTATKKFTQAGDKIRGMKSLLKSGDTEKIIFFAGMSRQKEVYVMAANYLQALNWQNDTKILKNIITFYTKGQSYDLLANFYAMCAQVEIDEYRDYDKAIKALEEASRCLTKVSNVQRVADNLHTTILEIRKFLDLQEAMEHGGSAGTAGSASGGGGGGEYQMIISGCKGILAHPIRPPIRQCDVQALLIEALITSTQYSEALKVLKDLATTTTDWSSRGLIQKSLIQKLAQECGIDFNTIWNSGRKKRNAESISRHENNDEDDEEQIEEEME